MKDIGEYYSDEDILKMKAEFQYSGYYLARGVFQFLFSLIGSWIIFIALIALFLCYFDIGVDDSDKDGFNRSGLKIHTDHKTGIQYLSDGSGGLIRRAE